MMGRALRITLQREVGRCALGRPCTLRSIFLLGLVALALVSAVVGHGAPHSCVHTHVYEPCSRDNDGNSLSDQPEIPVIDSGAALGELLELEGKRSMLFVGSEYNSSAFLDGIVDEWPQFAQFKWVSPHGSNDVAERAAELPTFSETIEVDYFSLDHWPDMLFLEPGAGTFPDDIIVFTSSDESLVSEESIEFAFSTLKAGALVSGWFHRTPTHDVVVDRISNKDLIAGYSRVARRVGGPLSVCIASNGDAFWLLRVPFDQKAYEALRRSEEQHHASDIFAAAGPDIFAAPVRLAMPRHNVSFPLPRGKSTIPIDVMFFLNDASIGQDGNYAVFTLDDSVIRTVEDSQVHVVHDVVSVPLGTYKFELTLWGPGDTVITQQSAEITVGSERPKGRPTQAKGIDHVYVCHWSKLTDRHEFLTQQLQRAGFDENEVTWITEFDRSTITKEEVAKYYRPSAAGWQEHYSWHRTASVWRNLSIGEICVTACHTRAYELMTLAGYDGAMVLEDDTSFAPNFISKWNDYMAKLNESQWDLIFFGLGDRNFVDHGGMFIPQQHPASRTAGSYAIRGKAAAKLQSSMVPFTTVSDGELDYQMWIHQMHVLWASPHLAWEATKGCSFYQAGTAFKSVVDPLRWKQERVAWRRHVHQSVPGSNLEPAVTNHHDTATQATKSSLH